MSRHRTSMVVLMVVSAFQSIMQAGERGTPVTISPSTVAVERHHYSVSARVRPLLVFWIRCNDVGDAVVTKRRGSDLSEYALLIGSDPERAPRRINTYTGELTPFSTTFGTEGPLAEVPLTASYQPRWWMQVDLALDDTRSGPQFADAR